MRVIGIDLGVRSLHISSKARCWSIIAPKTQRSEELQFLAQSLSETFHKDEIYAFVEEPVVAGARNIRTSLQMAQVCGVVLSALNGEVVPVSTWKKAVVGKGNASKDEVKEWLFNSKRDFPASAKQDHIDATCIRIYGETVGH